MGSCTSEGFATRFARLKLKRELRQALDPLVETIAELTGRALQLPKANGGLLRWDAHDGHMIPNPAQERSVRKLEGNLLLDIPQL